MLQGGGALKHLAAAGGSSGSVVWQTPLARRAYEVRARCHDLYIVNDFKQGRALL